MHLVQQLKKTRTAPAQGWDYYELICIFIQKIAMYSYKKNFDDLKIGTAIPHLVRTLCQKNYRTK